MKTHKLLSVLITLVMTGCVAAQTVTAAPEIAVVSSTQKVFKDEPLPAGEGNPAVLDSARNEYAPFQVAIHSDSDITVNSVEVSDFVSADGKIEITPESILLVETVTIEKPSIGTEKMVWPDPLPPVDGFDVKAGETRAVWVDLFVPKEVAPGKYSGTATLKTGAGDFSAPVELTVRETAVPTVPSLRTAFGIGYSHIAAAHEVEEGSNHHQELKEKYYWFIVNHRLSPYFIPVDLYSEKAHEYLDDPRVTFLRPPFSWNDDEAMKKLAVRLDETGWKKKAVFYMIDEPEPREFEKVSQAAKRVHSFDPEWKYLITHGFVQQMADAGVDIWCPVLVNTVDPVDMANLRGAMKDGKELWWYTCIGPKWHGMNYFIDEAATAPRLHPWMNHLYGVTGILYWNTNSWKRAGYNPWDNPMTYPGGNGDGSLLYPGHKVGYDGPVASIRIKMLREGMEDFELLNILRRELAEAAQTIGGAALKYDPKDRLFEYAFNMIKEEGRRKPMGKNTPYLMYVTTDQKHVEKRRSMLMDEIESMLVEPLLLVETNPIEGGYSDDGTLMIQGFVSPGSEVLVNGEPAAMKDVRFRAKITLSEGENEITITATNDGKEKTVKRIIYY